MHVDGGCHCGNITYEAEIDPEAVSICHCTDCQTLTGTAYRVNVRVRKQDLKMRGGTPRTYVKTAESGNKRAHAFCPDCGTPIYSTSTDADPQVYGLRVGPARRRAQPFRDAVDHEYRCAAENRHTGAAMNNAVVPAIMDRNR